jgi:ribosome-associated protein
VTDPSASDSLAFARRIVALARERRAEEPVLLDVRALVDYTDFFVLLTGRSLRQNQAIAEHLVRSMKAERRLALSKAGVETGTWICLDFGDAVVHVFDPDTRTRYDLELLWADAPRADAEAPKEAAADAAAAPRRRARTVRKAALADADAENAPDEARPPLDEPEPAPDPFATARAPRTQRTPRTSRTPGTSGTSATKKGGGRVATPRGSGAAKGKSAGKKSPAKKPAARPPSGKPPSRRRRGR